MLTGTYCFWIQSPCYRYIDACADLGLPQRELFITADLFDDKNFTVVLKNIEALARFAHDGIPGFEGPFIGKRKKKREGGFAKVVTNSAPQVKLSCRPPTCPTLPYSSCPLYPTYRHLATFLTFPRLFRGPLPG